MNTTEQANSIGALSACMRSLGFSRRLGVKHTASARVRHADKAILPGEIDVHFELRNMTDGPEITCDPDILKGYGIMFDNFRPWSQRFSFDPAANELRITSDREGAEYDFIFRFAPSAQ